MLGIHCNICNINYYTFYYKPSYVSFFETIIQSDIDAIVNSTFYIQ